MNYREQQLRQIIKRDYVPKEEYQSLQYELNQTLLDVDYQLQVNTKQENERLKQELKNLQTDWENRYQELETNLNHQAQQANQNQAQAQKEKQLYLNKITDLEQALLSLAKQKIKTKKEAKELLNQLETNWNNDKDTWKKEQAEREKQHQTEREQTHEEIKHLKQQLQQSHLKETELNKIQTQQTHRISFLESELNQTQTKLNKAQQDNQAKQEQINELQHANLDLQKKITDLTQTNTEQTKTIAVQLEQINQKDTKLTHQKQVLTQLLTNREQRLTELGGES